MSLPATREGIYERLGELVDVADDVLAAGVVLSAAESRDFENELSALHNSLLVNVVCYGLGNDQDVELLVKFFWPEYAAEMAEAGKLVLDPNFQPKLIRWILSGMFTELKEGAIKGCTGPGKGRSVATAACLWFKAGETLKSCKVIVTSQSFDHAKDTLMAEIVGLFKTMRNAPPARPGIQQIWSGENRFIKIINTATTEGISGQHSEATLMLFDEASSSKKEHWNQSETFAAMRVMLSNPRPGRSRHFRQMFPVSAPNKTQIIDVVGGQRFLMTVGGQDCINVQTGKALINGQITKARFDAIDSVTSPVWWAAVMARGEFTNLDSGLLLILEHWLDRHCDALTTELEVDTFSLDVSRSDFGDSSVLSAGGAGGCKEQFVAQYSDTTKLAGWVIATIREAYGIELTEGLCPLVIDSIGIGGPVGDMLAAEGVWIIEFNGAASSTVNSKMYLNLRAEGYGMLALRLDPSGRYKDAPFAMPDDPLLHEELCAPEREYNTGGTGFHITPKVNKQKEGERVRSESLTQLLGRSPDRADSFMYLYHGVRIKNVASRWAAKKKYGLVASGDPEDAAPLDDDEVEVLPPFLKDIIKSGREGRGSNWG